MEKLFEKLGEVNKQINEDSITSEVNICVIAVNASPFTVNFGLAIDENQLDRLEAFGAMNKKTVDEIIKKNIRNMKEELMNHAKGCTKKNIGIDLVSGLDELYENDNLMQLFETLTK